MLEFLGKVNYDFAIKQGWIVEKEKEVVGIGI
jgi:hypothetical protein